MDAKERLRLYLEQRRDAGESELVLDSMSVDEVMRMLGATATGRATAATGAERVAESASASAPRATDRQAPRPPVSVDASSGDEPRVAPPPGDWREALRALEPRGEPSAASGPSSQASAAREPLPRSDAERAPAPMPSDSPPAEATPAAGPSSNAADASAGSSAGSSAGVSAGASAGESAGSTSDSAGDRSHATMPLDQVPVGLVIGSPAHELFGGPESQFATLDALAEATRSCQLCGLHRTAKQAVPGHGNPHADLVCVGEAPGSNEDEQGLPFVGPAGQLLTKILGAIDLSREDVFICNVLKHRPPGNRNPLPDEVAACSPYLVRQIALLKPAVIVALGTFAAQTLLQSKEPIGKLRGKIHRYYGVPLIATYHPAALLRNPSWKRPTWEDVQLARRLLDRARSA